MLSRIYVRRVLSGTLVMGAVLASAGRALAGPPLICHPFEIGTAASLPWGQGDGWNAPLRSYDVTRLTADTLRLLSPEAAVPVRMETMRRATLYAGHDKQAAAELLTALLGRALNAEASGKPDALAWFDAGYLVESYRQASQIYKWNMVTGNDRATWALKDAPALDGYTWVQRAVSLSGRNADMQRAASLMEHDVSRTAQAR
jgi:hypothetical protein